METVLRFGWLIYEMNVIFSPIGSSLSFMALLRFYLLRDIWQTNGEKQEEGQNWAQSAEKSRKRLHTIIFFPFSVLTIASILQKSREEIAYKFPFSLFWTEFCVSSKDLYTCIESIVFVVIVENNYHIPPKYLLSVPLPIASLLPDSLAQEVIESTGRMTLGIRTWLL